MYTEDDIMTPRDRISDDMLRRLLNGNAAPAPDLAQNDPPLPCAKATADRDAWEENGKPLASVYAPTQEFRSLYDPETAWNKGTLFAELFFPFHGESVANKGGACRA